MAKRRYSLRAGILLFFVVFLLLLFTVPLIPRTPSLFPPLTWIVQLSLWMGEQWYRLREGLVAFARHYMFLKGASEERDRLLEENRELRFRLQLLLVELKIRERYEALWGREYEPWHVRGGRVVYHDPTDLYRDLWIHLSSPMPHLETAVVVSECGVVGRVLRGTGRFAHILSVYDPDSSVDVMTTRGTRGIAQGVGSALGRLKFVSRRDPLEVGEELLTTGKDGYYPPYLRIGWVETIRRNPDELFQDVEIRYACPIAQVQWVKVLRIPTYRPPSP